MTFLTCDLCDAYQERLSNGTLLVLPPVFQHFGKRTRFSGPAATLKVFEDNALVRTALESPGHGSVLVVDGGGSLRCALVGGNLGKLAEKNGWAGVIVYGCVRDVDELDACDIGLRALAVHPRLSVRKGLGDTGLAVSIDGVMVRPGDWIYADRDGVLVSHDQLDS
jgi:regulator of ribonuclease activity A